MTTLLHVEDDPELADLVQLTFRAFGFSGATLHAMTVTEAREILVDTTRYPELHLIVSDMHLPDGSGLDVVRDVRTHPSRSSIPILILSAAMDQATVDRAYALGANSFVPKSAGARPLMEVLKALYQHWVRDALLPRASAATRTQALVAKAVQQRARASALFARLSQMSEADPKQAEFWISLALRQGNLSNLLSFLQMQAAHRDLPEASLEQLEEVQRRAGRGLAAIECALDAEPHRSCEIGRDGVIDLLCEFEPEAFACVTSQLFPEVHVAVVAMRQVVVRDFDDVLGWLATQDGIPDERLARLREITAHLHELTGANDVARVASQSGRT